MAKDEKNSLKTRREFYIHRVVRNGKMYDEKTEIKKAEDTKKRVDGPVDYDTIAGKKPISYAESFGYRNDPKRYDAFRTVKKEEPLVEDIQINNNPVLEEPLEDKEIGYYDEGLVEDVEDNSEYIIDDEAYDAPYNNYEEPVQTYEEPTRYYNIPFEREDIKSKEREETYYNPVMEATIKNDVAYEELVEEPAIEKDPVNEFNRKPVNTYVQPSEPAPKVTPVIKKKKKAKYVAPPFDLLTKSDASNAENETVAKEQKAIINKTFEDLCLPLLPHSQSIKNSPKKRLMPFKR